MIQVAALCRADQPFERLIVEFHVTHHIGIDQLHDVVCGTNGGLFGGGTLANQQEGDDAEDGRDDQRTGQDQQSFGV